MASQNNCLVFLSLPPIFLHLVFCYAFWEIPSTLPFNFSVDFFFSPKKLFIVLNFQGLFSDFIVPLLFLIRCCSYFMDVVIKYFSDILVGVSFKIFSVLLLS